jgi:hypothetical protein
VIIHVIKMALYFYGLPPQNPYTYFNYEKKNTNPSQHLHSTYQNCQGHQRSLRNWNTQEEPKDTG